MNKIITAKKYKEMLLYGGEVLDAHKEEVNALNVFPVPDGDTGSNMNMTYQSGVQSIINLETNQIGNVAKVFSKGLLMGARGNSGVILSQFFRGIAEGLEGKTEVNAKEYHKALEQGVKRAYGSVIKAVEGTILTVVREMTETTDAKEDIIEFFELLIEKANVSLTNTPELLPVLKEVGVVDSGGQGLVYIFEGMLASLKGEQIDLTSSQNFEAFRSTEEHSMNPEEIEFGYCTEMLIRLDNPEQIEINDVRTKLEGFGDSIVAVMDEDILKIHVHTETPLQVFEYGLTMGQIRHIKSENMRIQAEEAQAKAMSERKEAGIVTVASSSKMADLFREIQNVEIIEGGQTLNPSIEDITKAIEAANAKKVVVLPNNSNIIMAAQAAKDLVEGVEVEIIPTKHMTQALECLINYNPEADFATNVEVMQEVMSEIVNVEITNAIKDTSIEGVEIKENDFMGIVNGKIKHSTAKLEQLLLDIANEAIEEDCELITILIGEDGNREVIEKLENYVEEKSPFTEITVYETEQPVYSYLISVL